MNADQIRALLEEAEGGTRAGYSVEIDDMVRRLVTCWACRRIVELTLTCWRPMETAPRDGTRILMLVDGSRSHQVRIAKFDAGVAGWYFDGFSDSVDDRRQFRYILGWLPLMTGTRPADVDEPAPRLDEKGRCCGRRPLFYKRPHAHHFCSRCDREYGEDGIWRPNWAWDGPYQRSAKGEAGYQCRRAPEVPR